MTKPTSTGFRLSTKALPDGTIEHSMESPLRKTVREIIKTRDEHVRQCLIALGWTPPAEDCEQKEFVDIRKGPFRAEQGLTVDQLKAVVNALPSKNESGEDYEVWMGTKGNDLTNPVKAAWALNPDGNGCDILLMAD